MARYRVNSKDPAHRALIARQQAARRKKVKSGKIKTHFVTTSGKVVANPAPTRYDKEGRPIISAANLVKIVYPDGRTQIVSARDAMRLITNKTIRPQYIGPVHSAAARRTAARRLVTRRPAAKRPSARRPAAKRPSARRPAAKRPSARRPAAKRPSARRPGARRTVARRPAARRPTARRPTARRPVAKRPSARRPGARRPVARRPAARRTARRSR